MEDLDNVSAPFPRYTGYSVPWYNPMGLGQSSPIQVEEFHTKYSVLRPEYIDKSLGFSAGSPRTVIKDSCGQYSTFFQQQGLAISYDIFIFPNCSTP